MQKTVLVDTVFCIGSSISAPTNTTQIMHLAGHSLGTLSLGC